MVVVIIVPQLLSYAPVGGGGGGSVEHARARIGRLGRPKHCYCDRWRAVRVLVCRRSPAAAVRPTDDLRAWPASIQMVLVCCIRRRRRWRRRWRRRRCHVTRYEISLATNAAQVASTAAFLHPVRSRITRARAFHSLSSFSPATCLFSSSPGRHSPPHAPPFSHAPLPTPRATTVLPHAYPRPLRSRHWSAARALYSTVTTFNRFLPDLWFRLATHRSRHKLL